MFQLRADSVCAHGCRCCTLPSMFARLTSQSARPPLPPMSPPSQAMCAAVAHGKPYLRRDWAPPLPRLARATTATAAPGWAHPCQICTGGCAAARLLAPQCLCGGAGQQWSERGRVFAALQGTAALHCGMTTVRQLGGARFALSLNRYERKKNVALAIDVRRPAPAGSVRHTPIRETGRSWRTRVHQQRRVCRCACECMCVQAWAEARRRLLVGAHPVSTLVIAGAMPSCCNVATLQRVATHSRLHARHRRRSAGRLLRGAHSRARSARCDCLRLLPLLWFAISAVLSCCGSHFTRVQEAMTRAWRKTCSTLPS